MAVGKQTSELIAAYKRSINQDLEQIKQLRQTKEGIIVKSDPNNPDSDNVVIVEGVQTLINRFDPATKGLDTRIVEINTEIRNIQSQILALGQSANAVGCGTTGSVVNVTEDTVVAYDWAFTLPNPFSVSTTTLTTSNLGVGTYVGVTQVSIGTYYGLLGLGTCVGYANSISTLEGSLSTYRSERDNLIVQVNAMKSARATFKLQKFGYDSAESKLNTQISEKSTIIAALEDTNNQQYFLDE